jgi:protein ImuB
VLAVWCPDWPVVVVGLDPADRELAAAVVTADRVVACSAAARAVGVRRGQRLRDAQRHCPALLVRGRDVDAEARAFEPVVSTVAEFCPRVEVVRPGVCAISTRGPARYFGGEEALAEKIAQAVAGGGFTCRTGVADGLFAARIAARTGRAGVVVPPGGTPGFIARRPVGLLAHTELTGLPEQAELTGVLARLAIHTLGDFAALRPADVFARFGVPGAIAHRLANGLEPRPLAPRPGSADLSVVMEFDPPAVQVEPVVFAGRALADRLHGNLAGRGLACVRVEVSVRLHDGRVHSRWWRHDGLLSSLAVAERVRWQLDGWRTGDRPGDGGAAGGGAPGGGIAALCLTPDQVVPDEGRQLGLWGETLVSDRVARAAAQVQSMLGHEAVTRPVLAGGRGPGEQVTLMPFGDSCIPRLPADQPWPGRIPAPAPITVYLEPRPASVTAASGELVVVTGRAAVSAPPARLSIEAGPLLEITAWAGPWPVHERWWDGSRARRRARFQLVTRDGAGWLAAVEHGRWMIEASYD